MDSDVPTVVIDNGSFQVKGGFAGEDQPRAAISSIVGHSRDTSTYAQEIVRQQPLIFTGDLSESCIKRARLNLTRPIKDGVIDNMEDTCKLWKLMVTQELRTEFEAQPLLLADSHSTPPATREAAAEVLFEELKVPSVYFQCSPPLALAAVGETSGVGIDIGFNSSRVVPVMEFYAVKGTARQTPVAGDFLTQRMRSLLSAYTYMRDSEADAQYIIQKYGSVTPHPKAAGTSTAKTSQQLGSSSSSAGAEKEEVKEDAAATAGITGPFILPDGEEVKVTAEEMQRTMDLLLSEASGETTLSEAAAAAITRIPSGFRTKLCNSMLLYGGSSQIPGIKQRLNAELLPRVPVDVAKGGLNITTYKQSGALVWMGGSVMASLSSFSEQWITKKEYEDSGGKAVLEKCPLSVDLSN